MTAISTSTLYPKIHAPFKRNEEHQLDPERPSLDSIGYLRHNGWIWTEKIEGMNMRVIWNGQAVSFGGRTDRAVIPQDLEDKLKELFPCSKMSDVFGETEVVLYGEGFGGKIQKGQHNYPDEKDFILFDIKIGVFWLTREKIEKIGESLGCKVVKHFEDISTLDDAVWAVEQGIQSELSDNMIAEGLVGTPAARLHDSHGDLIRVKVKTRDFPTKNNQT